MDLPTVLANASNPNNEIRAQAEAFLAQAIEAQYGNFLLALCVEFATEGKPETNRQLAGIYIKNLIHANDSTIHQGKIDKWVACDGPTKDNIRAGFLQALQSPSTVVSHTAAQVLAAFGSVDVPMQTWPNLLPSLFQNITDASISDVCKKASLEALGYMCDSMDPDSLEAVVVNQILGSIIDGMRADRVDSVRLAAVQALNNSLAFTGANFENDAERDAIVRAVCEATQSTNISIRASAFECFSTIALYYYEKLQPYFDTIYQLTSNAIRTDDTKVGEQAVEFWCSICEREEEILEELDETDESNKPPVYLKIMEQASPALIPIMLESMTKQEEDQNEDDSWNISMSAALCLQATSRVIGDSVVDLTLPFITSNIQQADWRLKEASIMAFCMILDGPSDEKANPLVTNALPLLLGNLQDASTLVRDTTMYTISKILEFHSGALATEVYPSVAQGILLALDDRSENVIEHACLASRNLGDAFEDLSEATSNTLSHFMPSLLQKLLTVAAADHDQENIRSSAYEAVNSLVNASAQDVTPLIVQLLVEALNRLEQTVAAAAGTQQGTQANTCALIGVIVKKLELETILPYADRAMQLILSVFNHKAAIAHEDAFITIGAIADKLEANFVRYLPALQPPLMAGLKNYEEHAVCILAVGVVGDICRNVGKAVLPACDEFMRSLLELLQSPTINRSVKPHVISVFADIAMAIEGDFERYAGVILSILQQAGAVATDNDDDDLIEYVNALRTSILEAYTGILAGLNDAKKEDCVIQHLESVVDFLRRCAEDENKSDEILKLAVSLLGDLGQIYGSRAQSVFSRPFVPVLLQEAMQNEEAAEQARWCQSVILDVQTGKLATRNK